jgi:hypothetical protein
VAGRDDDRDLGQSPSADHCVRTPWPAATRSPQAGAVEVLLDGAHALRADLVVPAETLVSTRGTRATRSSDRSVRSSRSQVMASPKPSRTPWT